MGFLIQEGVKMDKATQKLRAQIKADKTPRGELSPMAPKWLGKKNGPSQRVPPTICGHIEGGVKVPIRRRRKTDNSLYTVMIIVGGVRCTKPSEIRHPSYGHRCLEHSGCAT
jgi:hypothetical protein